MTDTEERPISGLRELRREMAEAEVERLRLEKALRQKTAFVELLKVVAAVSHEGGDIQTAMEKCIEQICVHLGWDVGHVHRKNEDGSRDLISKSLWYVTHPHLSASFRAAAEAICCTGGEGLAGRVIANRKPVWVADLSAEDGFPHLAGAIGMNIKSGFACPVLIGEEVKAVLQFFSNERMKCDDELLGVVAHIGIQLGRLSERKRVEEEVRKSEERYRSIIEDIGKSTSMAP